MYKIPSIEMSENQEATVVFVGSVGMAITGFLAEAPLPDEWKAPAVGLCGAISTAILVFWKTKINTKETA